MRILRVGEDVMQREPRLDSHDPLKSEAVLRSSLLTLSAKRSLDVVGSLILIFLASPLFAMIALIVSLDGGPSLFRHKRVGRNGEMFNCLKFRTMILGAEACLHEYLDHHPHAKAEWQNNQKLDFDPRITPVGRFLRATSLDELPQLFNILKGDMSLVGPRPVTRDELARYEDVTAHYLAVRPGLTGPWQISGRNETGYRERVALDHAYVDRLSFYRDLVILLQTPAAVLSRRGAK
jgi:exopolysaccharide production protein ExoY